MLGRVLPLLENLHSSGTARDTVALIANLDHVITVDTAVAHLSGALGIPTSVLLWSVPDWRWMLHRPDNAWYPTIRLYRKKNAAEAGPKFSMGSPVHSAAMGHWPRNRKGLKSQRLERA